MINDLQGIDIRGKRRRREQNGERRRAAWTLFVNDVRCVSD